MDGVGGSTYPYRYESNSTNRRPTHPLPQHTHPQPTAEAAAADDDHATPAAPPPLPASGAPFDPSNRGLRPRYPAWAERGGGGAGQLGARLRGVAMLMAYRSVRADLCVCVGVFVDWDGLAG